MTKVQILTRCEHCNGEGYLPAGEAEDLKGGKYTRYTPCAICEGTGQHPKWVSLDEFAALLSQAQCPHTRTYFRGGFHYNGNDFWDDIQEVCSDCGASL